MIIKWNVHNFGLKPTRKEFVRETEHFYVNDNGRRDSKNLRYENYFDTEAEALEFIAEMAAKRSRAREVGRIKLHAVELLEALEAVFAVTEFAIDGMSGAYYLSDDERNAARVAINKAKGINQ